MSGWRLMLGLDGAIGRGRFAGGVAVASCLALLGYQASLASLPWMADVLAPRGVNAGFALNLMWCGIGLALGWALIALGVKRLRDRGRSPWWAVAAVVPPMLLALINDAIFLVSRSFTLPGWLNGVLIGVAAVVALGVLAECLRGAAEPEGRGGGIA